MYNIFFFFFQAEDGIRDATVTGVQTCALPIFRLGEPIEDAEREETFRVNARVGEEAAVRGDPTARAPGGAFGPKLAQASEDRCRRPLEERLEQAVPETNRPERGVERKQP